MSDARPIRTITYDSPLLDLQPGDRVPVDGHHDHFVKSRELNYDGNEVWLRVDCSCGETFGGAFKRERLVARR